MSRFERQKRKHSEKAALCDAAPERIKYAWEILKQDKGTVHLVHTVALKHRPAVPFGAGAVRELLMLFQALQIVK